MCIVRAEKTTVDYLRRSYRKKNFSARLPAKPMQKVANHGAFDCQDRLCSADLEVSMCRDKGRRYQ